MEVMSNKCSVLTRKNGGRRRYIRLFLRRLNRESLISDVQRMRIITHQANAKLIGSHRIRVLEDHMFFIYQFIALSQKNIYSSLKRKKIY